MKWPGYPNWPTGNESLGCSGLGLEYRSLSGAESSSGGTAQQFRKVGHARHQMWLDWVPRRHFGWSQSAGRIRVLFSRRLPPSFSTFGASGRTPVASRLVRRRRPPRRFRRGGFLPRDPARPTGRPRGDLGRRPPVVRSQARGDLSRDVDRRVGLPPGGCQVAPLEAVEDGVCHEHHQP